MRMLKSVSRCCLSSLPALLCWTLTHGAEVVDDDRNAVSEVLVSAKRNISDATHLDASVQDLPIAIQSVPIELIEDEGLLRLGDAVRNVSGVVRKEAYLGVTDSFGIRGFDARTGLFNGFRHDFYDTTMDLAHVERVEVIKGPSSVSSGYLEPGGVVSVVTKSPRSEPITELQALGGSDDRYRLQGDFGRPLNSDLRARFTGAAETANSFRDDIKSNKQTLGAAIDWVPGAATRVELRAYWMHASVTPDRGFDPDTLGQTLFQLPRSRFLGEPSDSYRLNSNDLSAVLNQELGGPWSFRVGVERNYYADRRRATQTDDLLSDGQTVTREFTDVPSVNEISNAFAEVHGTVSTWGLEHRLIGGADINYIDFWYDFRRVRPVATLDIFDPVYAGPYDAPIPSLARARTRTTDTGVYAQDLVTLASQWKLLLGIRNDHVRQRDHDYLGDSYAQFSQHQTTPRVGIVYEPTSTLTLYTNFARSFNPQPGTTLASGAVPAPERGKQIEVGAKYVRPDDRLAASAAIYQITKSNIATPDPNDPDFSVLAGEERSRGFEFDLSSRPLEGLQLIFAYAYTDAVVTRDEVIPTGNHLLNVPPHQASLWSRYDISGTPLGVGLGVFYVGAREAYLPNTFKIPQYTRVDGAVYWKLRSTVDLALNVQNLTDKKYYDSQNSYIYPGAPITVLATVRWRPQQR